VPAETSVVSEIAGRYATALFDLARDEKALERLSLIQRFGDFRDAAIFAAVMFPLMLFALLPRLQSAFADGAPWDGVRPILLSTLIAAVVGYLVPTWYRANRKRISSDIPAAAHLQPSGG